MNSVSTTNAAWHFSGIGGDGDLGGTAERAAQAIEPIESEVSATRRELETTYQRTQTLHGHDELLTAVLGAAESSGGASTDAKTLADLKVTLVDGRSGTAAELLAGAGLLSLVDGASADGKASAKEIQNALDQLHSERDRIGSNNQMRMLQLQELGQQKNLLLQLASQELSSREQIERRIAENIR